MNPRVAITIAHWNGMEMLRQCLDALDSQTMTDYVIYIVDNGSTDGSPEAIEKNYRAVNLLRETENTGFAAAHNRAMQQALTDYPNLDYMWCVNNDSVPAPDFLERLVAAADKYQKTGSIQGKIVSAEDHSVIDATGVLVYTDLSAVNRGRNQRDTGQFAQAEEIWGPSASCALYRVAALQAIQLANGDYFDSRYFAYYEDVDLAWRLRYNGWSSWYTPDAIATHLHSATGKSHSPFKALHIHRNHIYNIICDLPFLRLLLALAFLPIRYVLLVSSVLRGKGASAKLSENTRRSNMAGIVLQSWWQVLQQLPYLLHKRWQVQRSRRVNGSEIRRWFREYRTTIRTIIYGE